MSNGSSADVPRTGRYFRLQTQFGVALGGLTLLTALVLAAFLSSAADRRMLRISTENLENLSQQMARELSDGMDGFSRDVQDQALRDRFTSRASSVGQMRQSLDQFKQNHPEFAYVSIVDVASKRVIAANGGIFEGGSAAGRPTFEAGKEALYLGDVHEAVRLAELLPKPESGETLRFLDVAAPIRDESGKTFRVFAAHVGWNWTDDVRQHVFGQLKEQRGVDAFIVDTQGKVVLSGVQDVPVGSNLANLVGARAGAARQLRWTDGELYLTTQADVAPRGRFRGFGWKVVARQPYALAYAPAQDLRHAFMLGALGLGLAAAVIAWLIAGRLTRPIRALAQAARNARQEGKFSGDAVTLPLGEVQEVERTLNTLTDSARMQAQAAETRERQFSVLADSLPQVVWQADAAGRLEYVNKPWLRERLTASVVNVADLEHVLYQEDCADFTAAWKVCIATGADLKARCRLQVPGTAHPRWHDIEAHAVKAADGRILRWIGTMFDVHEAVLETERTASRLREERQAREEAERLSRMRDEFMATVSHELRSPLSAIMGWSDILARKANADETLAKAAQVIRRNAMLQARLIDDLLDMTAVMAGKLTLSEADVDLATLAREVTLSHLHVAQQKGIALTCAEVPPIMVKGDAKRISQVFSNLVGNALKFTDGGGKVDVSIDTDDAQAIVSVKDTGQGISPSFLPHVFDRMRQEDSSKSRKAGGLGIGLAIAKAVVELHQGAIRADSRGPGSGAEFTFMLPLSPSQTAEPRPRQEEAALEIDLQGLQILLVDDERDAREVGQIALASMGAHVTLAASAPEGLQRLAHERFDLLVSDIGMPGMDGLAFIRALRSADGPNAAVPAVALSAFALESERAEGIHAGFDAYVTKPISLRRLGEGVLLARRRRQQARDRA